MNKLINMFKDESRRNPAFEIAFKEALNRKNRTIKKAPCVGSIPRDEIQRAVKAVSTKNES